MTETRIERAHQDDYQKLHQVRVAQEITVKDVQDSVDTSIRRYREGITNHLEVLHGQRSLVSAQLTLAQARATSTKAWCGFKNHLAQAGSEHSRNLCGVPFPSVQCGEIGVPADHDAHDRL
jgi:outer membrane protein TolC